jgi:hypothetical protein
MSISRVGSSAAQATTTAIPSHQAGDLIFIFAGRNNTTPAPVPSGWVQTGFSGASGVSVNGGWKIAKSSIETSGTWTNASVLICAVYRADTGILAFSAASNGANATGTSVSFPALTNGLVYRDGSLDNWYIGIAMQLNSANSLETAPSGMTNVAVESSSGVWKAVLHDTNASQLSNWATAATTVTTAAASSTRVVQLFEFDGPAFGGGGGGGLILPRSMNGGYAP